MTSSLPRYQTIFFLMNFRNNKLSLIFIHGIIIFSYQILVSWLEQGAFNLDKMSQLSEPLIVAHLRLNTSFH